MTDQITDLSRSSQRPAKPAVPLPSGPIGRLLASVGNLSYLLDSIHSRYSQDKGLGIRSIETLSAISEGCTSPGDIARQMSLPPSVVSGDLNQLIEAGMIRRERDRRDGRKLVYSLTPDGQSALSGAHQLYVHLVGDLLQSYPEAEVTAALRLLYDLTGKLRESLS